MSKKETIKYSLVLSMCVFFLIVVVFATTYAFFKPKIEGTGTVFSASASRLSLAPLAVTEVTLSNVAPIYDSTRNDNAVATDFTVAFADDNTATNACFQVDLIIDSLGSNFTLNNPSTGKIYGEYLKYEITENGTPLPIGTFENYDSFNTYIVDDVTKKYITLISNQNLTTDETNPVTSKTYRLKMWLSYDANNDQTPLLQGEQVNRSFQGHLSVTAVNKACVTN